MGGCTFKDKTNLVGLVLSTLEDLDHAFIFVVGAELVLQGGLAGAVQDTLGTVAIVMLEGIYWRWDPWLKAKVDRSLPVSYEDLPAVQHIAKGNAAVFLPLVQDVKIVNEDDEVVGATLVKDLGNGIDGTRHSDGSVF